MGGEINVAYADTAADLGGAFVDFGFDAFDSADPAAAGLTPMDCAAPGTISPRDLELDGIGSLPPSSVFSELATPASMYLSTPDEYFDASPMYDSLDAPEPVFGSLFPEEATSSDLSISPRLGFLSAESNKVVVHPGGIARKRSSTAASPELFKPRPSSLSGVAKRDKALPAIVVDLNDSVAVKRARNTAAARKSRDKKFKETELFKARIAQLEAEVEHWKKLALANAQ